MWNEAQQEVICDVKSRDTKACIGMDMRADSVGHTAKYGCYSSLELNEGKVLHIELVQVCGLTFVMHSSVWMGEGGKGQTVGQKPGVQKIFGGIFSSPPHSTHPIITTVLEKLLQACV